MNDRSGLYGRIHLLLAVFACLLPLDSPPARADDNEDGHALADLPAEEFLREVRRPLRQDAWADIQGRLIYSADGKQIKGDIRIRISFSPDSLHAQLILNGENVYGFEQVHDAPGSKSMKLDLPDTEVAPGLFSFGVRPEDLTFAFIYWDLVKELPRETFRRRRCRVFELAHPDPEKGTVRVWFSASRGFPLKAEWYRTGESAAWRQLELKGAKRHDRKLWFVKEARLEGKGWKTQVRFEHVELNPLEDKAAPAGKKAAE